MILMRSIHFGVVVDQPEEVYMSLADAKNCLARYKSDSKFALALQSSSREENARIAQDAGFSFSPEEWNEVVQAGTGFKSYNRAGCTFPNECK